MALPLSPKREAINLARLWRIAQGNTFPINAGVLAQEWSRNTVPEAPIEELYAKELNGFEGGLFLLKERKVWALIYNPHQGTPGRSNFTIAHEFGHYVLHRKLQQEFSCSQNSTLGFTNKKIEQEADIFASYLLMPIDDFSQQVQGQRITLQLLSECASRYGVSLTAAILKWLEFTDQAAIAVMGREGMLHWWKASDCAKKYGFESLRQGMELPSLALASNPNFIVQEDREGVDHSKGVWFPDIATREMLIVSDRYDMTISLLLLDPPSAQLEEDPIKDLTSTLRHF